MSKLREKSKFNLDAAEVLIKENLHAPSVHCSYYSCFQRIKCIFPEYFNLTYEQIDSEVASHTTSEHSYLIRYLSGVIKTNVGDKAYRNFSNDIKDLKKFRTDSDYKEIEVTSILSDKALNIAKRINTLLDETF
jgi:hypothetical protein